MDAPVWGALITAGLKVGAWLFERWPRSKNEQDRAREYVRSNYDTFHGALSDNSVRVLSLLEDSQMRRLVEVRRHLYPDSSFGSREESDRIDAEFKYRLQFLEMIGVVAHPMDEYYISQLWRAVSERSPRSRSLPRCFLSARVTTALLRMRPRAHPNRARSLDGRAG